ncbi:MAG: cbaB 1 [Candidatus Acidoferrum typicum]|nr:cbaB 1 [Candidatus Acidoferrum typicum]
MKKIAQRSPSPILPASLLGLAMWLSLSTSVGAQDQDVQVIEIKAKKYEYSRSPVHVKFGTKVQLKFTASDHDHGFKIAAVSDASAPNGTPGLVFTSAQDCWQLKKGETTIIEFLAQTPGTYTFQCCHTCGLGHKSMKGQIIVE